MSVGSGVLIFFGGIVAGVINAMAGGGSLLTVPLLSLAGVEGLSANGTNRIAVLVQSTASARGYVSKRVEAWSDTRRVLPWMLAGGLAGASVVSQLDDELFERIFGVLMIPLLVLVLWKPAARTADDPWPTWVTAVVFFAVGVYAGAIQAGVGLILLLVLARAGYDLVTANLIKSYVIVAVSAVACAIFVWQGQVEWGPALVLSAGMGIGGFAGAHIAVEGGEKVIKPVLAVAVVLLAGRMIGLY